MDLKDEKGPVGKPEKEKEVADPKEDDPCAFCASFKGRQDKDDSTDSSNHFMTERELKALKAMREIKKEVGEIKKRMKEMEEDLETGSSAKDGGETGPSEPYTEVDEEYMAADLLDSCNRMYRLKKKWEEWDEERMKAAEERMRLLGHIQ